MIYLLTSERTLTLNSGRPTWGGLHHEKTMTYSPIYQIFRGGLDITDAFNDRCTSIQVQLTAGGDGAGDTVKIALDDRDWKIAKPSVGEKLDVYLGYKETGMSHMGTFEISTVRFSWNPKTISIEGSSVGFQSAVKAPAVKNYDQKTVGDLIRDVAKSAGVQAVVSPDMDNIAIEYRNQVTSPLHMIQELEREYNGLGKWGDGKLSFTKRDSGISASGLPTPLVILRPEDILNIEVSTSTRTAYSKTRAPYYDEPTKTTKFVEAEGPSTNGSFPSYTIGRKYRDERTAIESAKSAMAALVRGQSDGQLMLVRGDPFMRDQSKILITGSRDGIDGSYVCDVVVHTYVKDQGLMTTARLRSDGDGTDFAPEATEEQLTNPSLLPGIPPTLLPDGRVLGGV